MSCSKIKASYKLLNVMAKFNTNMKLILANDISMLTTKNNYLLQHNF